MRTPLPDLAQLLRRSAAARDAIPPRARLGLAALSTIIVASIAFLLVFDWNWLRGPLAGAASARLEDWITTRFAGEPVIEGQMAARAKLTGYGNSVRAAAGSATGTLTVVAPSGELRQAFAELLGVNISKGLLLLLSESPNRSKVRCAVADFKVTDGIASANRIIVDTDVVLVKGEGTINLRTERLDLRFEGESKKPRLLRLFLPIKVGGPFTRPSVDLETTNALTQGGIGVALAALVNPLVAILPFVDPGLAKDANCAGLIAEGKRKGAPVKATR